MTKQIKSNGRKGFSLVELIVVIAIMAVLVAVLAPSLLSYVERSRAQKDESAMGEVTNAVLLALSDQDVYDELLEHSIKNNVSCYIDETLESKLGLDKTVTKEENHNTAEQYTYGDEARLNDEVAYYAAGNMRGVTITFKPSVGTKSTTYTLATGSINKFKENKGAVMQDCPTLYNTVRATVGDTIEQTSQTYRNSEYTIFIKLGSQGGADTAAQDAVQVYGQYSGTNLPAQASDEVNVATDRATGEGTSASTGNGASANLSGKAPVTMNGEATQTFDKGTPADVVFTSPADFSTFKGVAVNGVMISAEGNYTVEEGSTIVTLKSAYLKTLDNANYTVMIISDGQYATGTVAVTGEAPAQNESLAGLYTTGSNKPDITWDELINDGSLVVEDNAITYFDCSLSGKLIVDSSITGVSDSEEQDGVFYESNLTAIDFSNCTELTYIGAMAFAYSNNLVTVDFSNCNSLKSFSESGSTFESCTALETIKFPSSIESIASYDFSDCHSLKIIDLSHCTNLVSIGNGAFYGCYYGAESIYLPASITYIGRRAFSFCHEDPIEEHTNIYFAGTAVQWNNIEKGDLWDDVNDDFESNDSEYYTIHYGY